MEHYLLPKLPYPENAFEPRISAETFEYHHGKHHQAYVKKLNKLIEGSAFEALSLEEIIMRSHAESQTAIFNNAAQNWNHTFFWNCLSPETDQPTGELLNAINRDFGSLNDFKQQFHKKAVALFGSGWVWLVKSPVKGGRLTIESTSNADNPLILRTARTPILTCDVWEHAYYIDYRNERPKFVEMVVDIFNWRFASQNYESTSAAPGMLSGEGKDRERRIKPQPKPRAAA